MRHLPRQQGKGSRACKCTPGGASSQQQQLPATHGSILVAPLEVLQQLEVQFIYQVWRPLNALQIAVHLSCS